MSGDGVELDCLGGMSMTAERAREVAAELQSRSIMPRDLFAAAILAGVASRQSLHDIDHGPENTFRAVLRVADRMMAARLSDLAGGRRG